jgi:hypothetical protein
MCRLAVATSSPVSEPLALSTRGHALGHGMPLLRGILNQARTNAPSGIHPRRMTTSLALAEATRHPVPA